MHINSKYNIIIVILSRANSIVQTILGLTFIIHYVMVSQIASGLFGK